MPQTHGCLHSPRACRHQGTRLAAVRERGHAPANGHARRARSRKMCAGVTGFHPGGDSLAKNASGGGAGLRGPRWTRARMTSALRLILRRPGSWKRNKKYPWVCLCVFCVHLCIRVCKMGLVVALCYVILILHMGKTRLVLPALAAHLCATELQTGVLAPDPDLFPAGSIFIPKQVGLGGAP